MSCHVGQVVGLRVMLGMVICHISGLFVPIETELSLCCRTEEPMKSHPNHFNLSLYYGVMNEASHSFQPISSNAFQSGIISRAVVYTAASSASAANALTNFRICDIVSTGPLLRGMGSSSTSKMWAPARLHDLGSVRKLASECDARTIVLA